MDGRRVVHICAYLSTVPLPPPTPLTIHIYLSVPRLLPPLRQKKQALQGRFFFWRAYAHNPDRKVEMKYVISSAHFPLFSSLARKKGRWL